MAETFFDLIDTYLLATRAGRLTRMDTEKARGKSEPNDAAREAAVLADFINTTTILAKELRDNHEPIDDFPLDNADCATAAEIPGIPAKLKKKLQTMGGSFTTAEVATVLKCLAAAMAKAAEPLASILAEITMKLGSCLMANVFPDTPASETTRQPKIYKDCLSIQDYSAWSHAPDLEKNSGQRLYALQTPFSHPERNGVGKLS